MTDDELRALLTKRIAQGEEVLALIKRRPHPNRMFNETLRMAATELKEAASFWREHLGKDGNDEEGVKAHLLPRYIEFARCRSRVLEDFHEMDEMEKHGWPTS